MTATATREQTARHLRRLEQAALDRLRDGYTIAQVAEHMGLTRQHLHRLIAAERASCRHAGCGQPQAGAGRPRSGWVQVKLAAGTAVWLCSWRCVALHALQRGGAA